MKIIKIKALGIEVEQDVHNKNECLEDIKIPRGWRLLTAEETIFLANSKYANKLKMFSSDNDFFIKQPFKINKKKGYIALFGALSGGAFLSCLRDPQFAFSEIGVRFCRSLNRR